MYFVTEKQNINKKECDILIMDMKSIPRKDHQLDKVIFLLFKALKKSSHPPTNCP